MSDIQFGLLGEDGTILREVETCAISGDSIETGDAMVRVSGTPFFFRVASTSMNKLTPEKRAEIEAQVPKKKVAPEPAPVPVVKKADIPAS